MPPRSVRQPGTRILLAEDNPDHQRLLCEALLRHRPDLSITVVNSGRRLIEMLRSPPTVPFDCLVLDFNLRDYQGHTLLQELHPVAETCAVVVISSSTDQNIVIESMRSGSLDFVPKEEAVLGSPLWESIQRAIECKDREQRERRRTERRIQRLSRLTETDPLTDLGNRRHFDRLYGNRRTTFDRRGDTSCAMVDVDHFKKINDQLGHRCGDLVLRSIAHILMRWAEEQDTILRWGGEEFLAVIAFASAQASFDRAEVLRRIIETSPIRYKDQWVHVTVSIGVATAPSAEFGPETIQQADQALYLAKQSGRNRVCSCRMVAMKQRRDNTSGLGPDAPGESDHGLPDHALTQTSSENGWNSR